MSDLGLDLDLPATVEVAERHGLPVLVWPALSDAGVDAVVTTRLGGVSTGAYGTLNLGLHVGDDDALVLENRRRAAEAAGLGLDDLVFCNQAHGRVVVPVGEEERGRGARSMGTAIRGADALLTRTPGLGLVVMVADCVPIILFDPGTRTLAAVHAGWRGTVAGVVPAALERLVAGGADPAHVVAALGPAIPADRYEVGQDVADAARAAFGGDAGDVLSDHGDGTYRFDLWAANRHQLLVGGLAEDNVQLAAVPTAPDTPFFSDRQHRPCGRFAALAQIRP